MVGDAGKHIGKPGARVDVVESGGADERIHGCRSLPAAIRAGEQPGFPVEGHHPFILPMSVKSWKSITRGTPVSGARFLFGA